MKWLDKAVALTLPWVPKTIVGRFSRPYIAGVHAEDAFACAARLRAEGARSTLDILGEFIETLDQAQANVSAYCNLLALIEERGLDETNISVKLTALGLLIDPEACRKNIRQLVAEAASKNTFVRLDMEDSGCTDATLSIYRELRTEFPGHVGCVLQSRLRRTMQDIESLVTEPTQVRLCKGIYLEPREIAFVDADEIRENFIATLTRLFESGAYVAVATHDDLLTAETERLIRSMGLGKDRYEFQMLLGVRGPLRRSLLKAGHPLRVYIPFGEEWYAYSVRRLQENPEIAGHALRSIFSRR
jgi:proline dehydrogenase